MTKRIHETKNAVTFYDDEENRLQIMHADWEHTQTIFVSIGRNRDDDVKDRVIEIDVHDFLKVVEVVREQVEPAEAMRDALVEAHAAAEQLSMLRSRLAKLLGLESDDG